MPEELIIPLKRCYRELLSSKIMSNSFFDIDTGVSGNGCRHLAQLRNPDARNGRMHVLSPAFFRISRLSAAPLAKCFQSEAELHPFSEILCLAQPYTPIG
jgi:hypothetical protein